MAALRGAIGPAYPLGFTSFPYVDYHPRLPYSVFLGPGGAQANLPQVYWKAIGGTVDAVSAKTVAQNRIYGVPLAPLGQSYDAPKAADLRRFRALWAGYGAGGLSWWSWQASQRRERGPCSPSLPGARRGARPGLARAGPGLERRPGGLAAAAPRLRRPGGRARRQVQRRDEGVFAGVSDRARAGGDGGDRCGDVAGLADVAGACYRLDGGPAK